METAKKKSGLVVLVGRSNVGKSTLLNELVGTKIAITTPKPQTTRHTIQGVIHDARGQIVVVDTPGIFGRAPDVLTGKLNDKARESLSGVDALVYVVDPSRHVGDEEAAIHRLVSQAKGPKILVLNKNDIERPFMDEYLAWQNEFTAVVDISALNHKNLKALVNAIIDALPEGEPLYPPDAITDMSPQFRLAELIREKVFLAMHEEIPYSTAVEIDEMSDRENGMLYIRARVITTSPRYKKMLIGEGARRIKHIGAQARKELEMVTGKKVYLELEVDVEPRWQERFE